ncbi:MAG: RNA polymerase sigma factor [Steroidobacteraceae bacterium]
MREINRGRELERVLATHAAALARLAASYESRPALREELLQDIAFALWRALPSFRHEASEKTFVMRIATNRALSHLAARTPAADALDAASEITDAIPRPDELTARLQTVERLQRAVHDLPLPLRQVLVLAFEGLDHEDIGRVLGLTANNVAVRLHRGKALLKKTLGETS